MDLGSLFLILALFILVALFVSRPFLERQGSQSNVISAGPAELPGKGAQEFSALLAKRDRILNSLQELDFDNTMGKIPEVDYPVQRAALVKSGAEVLRQLDELRGAGSVPGIASDKIDSDKAQLEAALAEQGTQALSGAYVSNGRRRGAGAPDDDLEAKIASRRRVRQEKAAGFCPQCGGPVQKSDVFCPKCGARL